MSGRSHQSEGSWFRPRSPAPKPETGHGQAGVSRWLARRSGLLSADANHRVTECRPSSPRYDEENAASHAMSANAARLPDAKTRAGGRLTRSQSAVEPVRFACGPVGQSQPNVSDLLIAEAEMIRALHRGGGARLRAGGLAVRLRHGLRPEPRLLRWPGLELLRWPRARRWDVKSPISALVVGSNRATRSPPVCGSSLTPSQRLTGSSHKRPCSSSGSSS